VSRSRPRIGFIALVVPEPAIPYFGELAALIITAARRREWNLLIQQTRGDRNSERATLDALGPHLVVGAIISSEALHNEDLSAHDSACRS
jgi:LacI family transcriptional regulator, repressor for deo operon, udp, cdd, tsx, nupC, and nupG